MVTAASLVLRQFEDYGCIVKKKIEPGGNWMHLQYSSNLEAAKALAKDGKILDHKIMIGVRRCIDMDFTHIVTVRANICHTCDALLSLLCCRVR